MTDAVVQLVETVRTSPKYRFVCEPLIRRIGAQELAKRHRLKEAVKATKNKLHQVAGAYVIDEMHYEKCLIALRSADDESLKNVCREIMANHASTRERLPILDEFYPALFSEPISSVLDLACGLNPLAIPFIPLAPNATYYAYDIFEDMMAFLQQFFELMGVRGKAEAQDIGQFIPKEQVQVALVLKTLPCLEQVDKTLSLRLLESLNAERIVVSYPVHSLGGRQKGMIEHYESHLHGLVAGKTWKIRRVTFETELVFVLENI